MSANDKIKNETSSKKADNRKDEGEKDIFFIIIYQTETQEKPDEFAFIEKNINPQNIFTDEIKQGKRA